MTHISNPTTLQRSLALLRFVLGVILLATWWENLQKGLYTAQGLNDLFFHPDWGAFNHGGGVLFGYRDLIEHTILQVPGLFATFQMGAELLMGIALAAGGLTRFFGAAAAFFFLNLFLTYAGNSQEWIWTYVLLFTVAVTVAIAGAGREWGLDALYFRRSSTLRKLT